MGCDIHGMVERKSETGGFYWKNSGDPSIGRNYVIFAVLANVRNYDNYPFISESKGMPDDLTKEMELLVEYWGSDGHSHSWITLKEMKEYDIEQKVYCSRLVTGRDKDGNITSTCLGTNSRHMGEVGEITVFDEFKNGRRHWIDLIVYLEDVAKKYGLEDNEVRFVFFFDN